MYLEDRADMQNIQSRPRSRGMIIFFKSLKSSAEYCKGEVL